MNTIRGLIVQAAQYAKLIWYFIAFQLRVVSKVDYYGRIGKVYFDLLDYKRAVAALERCETANDGQDPRWVKFTAYYLGICYVERGDVRKGVGELELYARFKPESAETAGRIAFCYRNLCALAVALKWYQRACDLDPQNVGFQVSAALLLDELGMSEQGVERLIATMELCANPVQKEILEAALYQIRGELPSAIAVTRALLKDSSALPELAKISEHIDMSMHLAWLLLEQRDFEGALSVLESELRKYPHDPALMVALARVLAEQDRDLDRALTLLDRALTEVPRSPVFLESKARILHKMGRKNEAIELAKLSLELNPDFEDAKAFLRLASHDALDGRVGEKSESP
jgi:tetratricopeptide (TPR) repeat protein